MLRAKLCNEILESKNSSSVSVIILGTDHTVESIAGAFAAGADDYICIPCAPAVLQARIGGAVRQVQHIERNVREERRRLVGNPNPLMALYQRPPKCPGRYRYLKKIS